MRRLPGRCYLCGDPCLDDWFCAAHLWAGSYRKPVPKLGRLGPYHAYWVERFRPDQILELAAYMPERGNGVPA